MKITKKSRRIRLSTVVLLLTLLILLTGTTVYRYEIEKTLIDFFLRFFTQDVELIDYKVPQLVDSRFSEEANIIMENRVDPFRIETILVNIPQVGVYVP